MAIEYRTSPTNLVAVINFDNFPQAANGSFTDDATLSHSRSGSFSWPLHCNPVRHWACLMHANIGVGRLTLVRSNALLSI